MCERHHTPLMAAAVQFPLAHPVVDTVLTGARSVAELEQTEAMMRAAIPADLWVELQAEGLLPADAPVPVAAPR